MEGGPIALRGGRLVKGPLAAETRPELAPQRHAGLEVEVMGHRPVLPDDASPKEAGPGEAVGRGAAQPAVRRPPSRGRIVLGADALDRFVRIETAAGGALEHVQ